MPLLTALPEAPDTIVVGRHRLPLIVKRHQMARRISLRYNPTEHGFSLTMPSRMRLQDGISFIHQQHDWVIETLALVPQKILVEPGAIIPVLGEAYRVVHHEKLSRRMKLASRELRIGGPREEFPQRIEQALRRLARKEILKLALDKADDVGKPVRRVSLRDTRSRWGSCSARGGLSFSWRLVFAPYHVLDYVVSHEVAHLRHMNHSQRFWDLVEELCPHHERARAWLKDHAQELYRYTI